MLKCSKQYACTITMTVPIGDEAVKIIAVHARRKLWRILLNDLLELVKWVFPRIIRKLSCGKLNLPKQHITQP